MEKLAIYIIVVLGSAMLLVVAFTWRTWFQRQQVNTVATIVTVIGVLGTFLGIAIGLYQFDPDNIKESIPLLLEGLKTAFVTSIIGIFLSIILKIIILWRKQISPVEVRPGATVEDLADLLQKILDAQQEEGKETRGTLRSIEKSLTGDGDSTVLTQLQKLRTTFSDKQDDLIQEFKDFADKMRENNINALIEALNAVMRDFNAKINEQFGDNFKQLNEAVGKLLDWQKQYRHQMDELAKEFRVAAESIEKSRASLEVITDRSATIVSSAEKLEPILQATQHQISELDNHLKAFNALADNARDAFPVIEDRLNQLTDGFSTAVKHAIDDSHASMEGQRNALAEQSQQLERMVENTGNHIQQQTETVFQKTTARVEQIIDDTFQGLRNTLEKQSQTLVTMVEDASGQVAQMATDFSKIVKESIDNSHADMERQRQAVQDFTGRIDGVIQSTSQGLEKTLTETNLRLESTLQSQSEHLRTETERIFQENGNRITQQIQTLDDALRNTLTESLESFGSHLTSLSSRFVDDYRPLTEQLRAVVQIANSLPQPSSYQR